MVLNIETRLSTHPFWTRLKLSAFLVFGALVSFCQVAEAQAIRALDFKNEVRNIRFDKNGCPLDYHAILGNRWQHLQDMMRLPDSNGKQYYMGTFSQNCSDDEGGLVFVGELEAGQDRGKVIWWDELNNGHSVGGFNHPGDIRRIGNTVIIAGQNWDSDSNDIPFIDKMNLGNGGQAVLFYDVSQPSSPKFMGGLNSCWDGTTKVTTDKEIDTICAAKSGEYYYLYFNGIQCRANSFTPQAKWELIEKGWDAGTCSVEFPLGGQTIVGGARLVSGSGSDGARVVYEELLWDGNRGVLSDQTRQATRRDVMWSSTLRGQLDVDGGNTFSLSVFEDGRGAIVIADVESDDAITIQEVESVESDGPITGLYLAYGRNANAPQGYTMLPVDLNRDAGGSDIHLCYSRDASAPPLTHLAVTLQRGAIPTEHTTVPNNLGSGEADLNKGAGGKDIFLSESRSPNLGGPIKRVNIMIGENAGAPPGWEMIKSDLNSGAGGNYLWIAFSRN